MDVIEYVNEGIIGCNPTSSVPAGVLDWDNSYARFRATFDNFQGRLLFFYESLIGTYKYIINNYDPEYSYTVYLVGIDMERYLQVRDYYIEICNIYAKNLKIKGKIFWNTLLPQGSKQNGIVSIFYPFVSSINDPPNDSLSFETLEYEVDLTNKQNLTREIYNDYVNAVSEYLYRVKVLIKMLTNSDLEEFQIPTI